MEPGGYSMVSDVDKDVETVHEDAGIRWWLDFIKAEYGPWEAAGLREFKGSGSRFRGNR